MKIRFGMLAVDAYGKAGGQCIQRRGSVRVLRNITIPTQRLSSRQNPQRFINSRFFNSWSGLSSDVRRDWETVASNISAVNGWGESKSISGREAYIKFNSLQFAFDNNEVAPIDFVYTAPSLIIKDIEIDQSSEEIFFNVQDAQNNQFFQLKGMRLRSAAQNPNVSKLKTYMRQVDLENYGDIYNAFTSMVGLIRAGDVFSMSVRIVGESCVVSPWIQQTVIAT